MSKKAEAKITNPDIDEYLGVEEEIEEEEEPEEISEVVYRMFLLEMLSRFKGRVNHMEYLLEKLYEAKAEPRLNVYCYESEEDVQMITVEKGGVGFGVKQPCHTPPEGYEEINDLRYEAVLKDTRDSAQEEIIEIERLLQALEDARENSVLRLRFFKGSSGASMEIEEKGPLGFKINGRGS